MEKFGFKIIKTSITTEEGITYLTNGLCIVKNDIGFKFSYPDICIHEEDICILIERLSEIDLDIIHIQDIIYDYIEELAGVYRF